MQNITKCGRETVRLTNGTGHQIEPRGTCFHCRDLQRNLTPGQPNSQPNNGAEQGGKLKHCRSAGVNLLFSFPQPELLERSEVWCETFSTPAVTFQMSLKRQQAPAALLHAVSRQTAVEEVALILILIYCFKHRYRLIIGRVYAHDAMWIFHHTGRPINFCFFGRKGKVMSR